MEENYTIFPVEGKTQVKDEETEILISDHELVLFYLVIPCIHRLFMFYFYKE